MTLCQQRLEQDRCDDSEQKCARRYIVHSYTYTVKEKEEKGRVRAEIRPETVRLLIIEMLPVSIIHFSEKCAKSTSAKEEM